MCEGGSKMLCQTILLFHFLHLFHLETSRQIHKIELRVAMMVVVEVISNRMQLKLKIQAKSIRAEKWYIIHGENLSGNDEPFPLKQNDDGGASSSGPSDSNSISSVLFFMMRMTFLKERERAFMLLAMSFELLLVVVYEQVAQQKGALLLCLTCILIIKWWNKSILYQKRWFRIHRRANSMVAWLRKKLC